MPEHDARQERLRWYRDVLMSALVMQRTRLLGEERSGDRRADVWFALIALRNSLRLARLVANLTGDESLSREVELFDQSQPARGIRNVFEHLDKFIRGDAERQEEFIAKPPMIEIAYGEKVAELDHLGAGPRQLRIEPGALDHGPVVPPPTEIAVRVAGDEVQIGRAIGTAQRLLWQTQKALEKSDAGE
jgi:hypothetical protein